MYKNNNIYIMLSMYIAIIKFDSKLCIFLPTYPMKFIWKIINFKILRSVSTVKLQIKEKLHNVKENEL